MRLSVALFALLSLALIAYARPAPPDGPFSTAIYYDARYQAYPNNPVEFSTFTEIVETRVGGSPTVTKSPGATTYSPLVITVPVSGFYNDSSLKAWYNEDPGIRGHMKDVIVKIRSGSGTLQTQYFFYRTTPASRTTGLMRGITYATYIYNYTTFERDLGIG
jgi:hypothetical protein